MHTLPEILRIGKQHPLFEVAHDWELITRRYRELRDTAWDAGYEPRYEFSKIFERALRVIQQYNRGSISAEAFAAAIRRERLRLVPNEPAPASPAA
jgi:hypothetical protein